MANNQTVRSEEKAKSKKLDKYSITIEEYDAGVTKMLAELFPPKKKQNAAPAAEAG